MSYQHFLEPKVVDGHLEKKLANVQGVMYSLGAMYLLVVPLSSIDHYLLSIF
jgi:hypothetical protein